MGNTEASKWKLIAMFSLNFTYFLVELVVGYLTHSMALVADSFHMLSDVVALCVAYFAVKVCLTSSLLLKKIHTNIS